MRKGVKKKRCKTPIIYSKNNINIIIYIIINEVGVYIKV